MRCAEIFARQHRIERHHAAIGGAEDDGQRIELAEPADEQIARDRERLHEQAGDQHRLDAEPVGEHAEQQAAAEPGEALDAVDADRRHRRDAADHGVAHHVEDRPGMRRAAQRRRSAPSTMNCGERNAWPTDMPALSPAGRGHAGGRAGGRRRGAPAAPPGSAAPRRECRWSAWRCASRRSVISQRANGEIVIGATPMPAETSETARLRLVVEPAGRGGDHRREEGARRQGRPGCRR